MMFFPFKKSSQSIPFMDSLLHARHCAMDYIFYLINSQEKRSRKWVLVLLTFYR